MPHQDHGSVRKGHGKGFHFTALQEVLQWLLPSGLFAGMKWRSDSRWRPSSLAACAVLWAWSEDSALKERFTLARKIVGKVLTLGRQAGQTYQGFLKRLRKWSGALLPEIVACFRQRMEKDLSAFFTVAGYVLMAIDGSRVELPRTVSNENRFGAQAEPPGNRRYRRRRKPRRRGKQRRADKKKASSPQIWMTVLYHVTLGLPWAWRRGPSGASERDHLLEMIDALPLRALLTADAGFIGYEYWKALHDRSFPFVIRVGANVRLLKKLGYVREYDGLVYLWPDKARKGQLPPLVLRLTHYVGGRDPIYLVTNVLARSRLSDKQLLEIYCRRWEIEGYYRSFKQTFQRRKLGSRSPDPAELEFDWSVVGLWALCLHAIVHRAAEHEPQELSVAAALRAYRQAMKEYKSRPDPREDLWTKLQSAVKDTYERTRSKQSRTYPRKKQKQRIGAPQVIDASKAQRQVAAKVKLTVL